MVGRTYELGMLRALQNSSKPAFVAVYGRRRIGKTYLIRHAFGGHFTFQLTGIAQVGLQTQLMNFYAALVRYFPDLEGGAEPSTWFGAFQMLIRCLERQPTGKQVVFLDELPWLDTPQSQFIPALEHFWNSWGSARTDLVLIVCGSAASWMVHNLINSKGGLHNRVTHRIRLQPFTLAECEALLRERAGVLDRYQILQLYMALGGVPFYWEQLDTGMSAAQNIDRLFFTPEGMLRTEYSNLYAALFRQPDRYTAIIEALARKPEGMTREELLAQARVPNGGNASRLLRELEESSFIVRFRNYSRQDRHTWYRLADFYSMFYVKFVKQSDPRNTHTWLHSLDSPQQRAWSGLAFEQVCQAHVEQIKHALGIGGVSAAVSAWRGGQAGQQAQVDLVIDRRDHVINLCEMKFSMHRFAISKGYAEDLRQKAGLFRESTRTRKSIFLTMITTFGIEPNAYAASLVQQSLTMDALFTDLGSR